MGEPFLGDGGVSVVQPTRLRLELIEQGTLVVVGHRRSVVAFGRSHSCGRVRTCMGRSGRPALGYALPRDADRDRDALRDPAARGRLAARPRRGRRRRPVRRQVPRRRPGSARARRRVARRRAGPGDRAARARPRRRRGRSGARRRRARRGDPRPRPSTSGGLNLGMDFLPGRADLQPGRRDRARGHRPGVRRRRRLARRACRPTPIGPPRTRTCSSGTAGRG